MDDTVHTVSRPAEQRAVAAFLTSATTMPCALVIEGEAGIGKTTFWLAVQEQARERGLQVLSARPAAAETVLAYAVLTDLLSSVDPAAWTNLPEPQRLAVDRVMLRTIEDDIPADPRAVAAAFLAVIEHVAEHETLVLAIDDLQWVDPSSASVIAFAARRLSGRVGILAAVRTDGNENPGTWLQPPRPDSRHRVKLRPMILGPLQQVVSRRLGRSFARSTMLRIAEVSGGNPFYAIELAREIDDETDSADIKLPATLVELVQSRLVGLDSETQDMLLAAACLAEPTVELLARAVEGAPNHVGQLLETTEAAGVLVLDGHRVRFSHPLIGGGVYTGATPARRRTMHRRLAGIVVEPELRARHLALAATHGDSLTLESLDAAAEIASIRGAPAAAAELLDLAIGLGGHTAQRQILSATHHFNAGDAARAHAMLQQVIEPSAPPRLRAQALTLLGTMSQVEDSLLDGAEYLERALADAGDNVALRIQILVSLSWIQIRLGRHAASARNIEDAVEYAERLGRSQLLSQALGMWVVVRMLLGNGFDDQNRRRALELGDRQAAIPTLFSPGFMSAMALAWTGRLDEAHDEFVAVRRSCIDRGDDSDLVFVSFHSVLNEIWRADFDEAALIAEDAIQRAQQLDGALQLSAALTARAIVAAYAGRENDARRDVSEAIGPVSHSGSQLLTASTVAVLGFLEVSLGNYEAAINLLEPPLRKVMAAPEATEIFVASFIPDAIEAMIALGRLDDAANIIKALERNGHRLDRPWMLAIGARGRAMLLAAQGDLKGAMVAVEAAMVEHDRLPMPFERARTQLLLGQLQRRRRMKSVASSTLRSVLEKFEELKTPLWAERTREELARVKVGPQSGTALSAAEQRVAELAASGMTNREVAATMLISPKTVETNLARVYRKLGIRSRAELGRSMGQPPQ
jgi:ATP/maltotriose-dependent transcriptional regulator MalT